MALPARSHLPSRAVVLVLVACALLSLIWSNANGGEQLRKTYESLSKQAKQSTASTVSSLTVPSTSISDKQSDAVPHDVPALSISPEPFPPLPPPDDEEYMSICMAGEHLSLL